MNFEPDIKTCIETLQSGGLILYPTDTIWGIGCDASNTNAVQRIYDLKRMTNPNGLIVLLASDRDILHYVASPDPAVFDFLEMNSAPTTIIYDGGIGVADNVLAYDGTIAIRIAKDEFCKHLIKRFGKPIVSTSASLLGEPTPGNFTEINPSVIEKVDYVVAALQQNNVIAKPSTLVKWAAHSSPIVLRP